MVQMPEPTKVSQIKKTWVNCLVYGQSGTGKTIFGAGFPKPILLIDTDKGILSIKTFDLADKDEIAHIEVEDLVADSIAPQGYDIVAGILESLLKTGSYGGITPATFVIDSFTTLSQMCLGKAQFLNGHYGQQPTLPDYGGLRRYLERIIRLGVAVKMNFVAVCHESFRKDENTGRLWLLPMIVGKLADEISLYFDEVYHSGVVRETKGEVTYNMECSASGLITAKSRLGLSGVQKLSFETIRARLERVSGRTEGGGAEQESEKSGGLIID